MSVKIGDIVTVVSDTSIYRGEQGEVVEIKRDSDEDGPIGVRFHPRQVLHCISRDEDCIVRHRRRELRVDTSWGAVTRAKILYPGHYHTVYTLRFEFSPQNQCMHARCTALATKRCVLNVLGTVCERDFCDKHGKIDGMVGEVLPPMKTNYVPATPIREAVVA